VLGIEALARLGEGTLTMADVDIALIAGADVPRALFDKVVGDLDAALPDVFSLKASLRERPAEEVATVTVQFTATRSPEGEVQLRGLLADERMRGAVDAFARARFGAGAVYTATRLDADAVPAGWSVRVLAGLAALSELAQGALLVEPERLEIRGTTGSTGAQAEIARLLSEQLGPGAEFRIDVVYDEKLDPVASMPTPDRCVADATAVLAGGKINFAPGSATLDAEAFRAVERLAEVLRPCIDVPLEIGGHTDSQGRAETNLALSERRAEAVRNGLMQLRIPVGHIVARGYGSAEPVGDNGTEEGREANRRITVRLRLPADGDGTATAQADATAAADDGGIARGQSPASDADDGDATAAQDADADATNLVADADAGDTETDAATDDADWTSAAPQDKTIRPRGRPEER
jgi:OOP family OmpA-OmpF porin